MSKDDDHHLVVDGRRWRRTDPTIPEPLRKELVRTLMQGRRAVGAVKRRDGDEAAVVAARRQVHDAKVALGERGEPWWEPPTPEGLDERAAATVMSLLRGRAPTATVAPSDVARCLGGPGWRSHSERVRRVTADLADRDVVIVLQHGEPVVPRLGGQVRIARGPAFDEGRPRRD